MSDAKNTASKRKDNPVAAETATDASKKAAVAVDKTPFDMYFEKMNAVIERTGCLGSMVVRGLSGDSDDEDEDDDDDDDDDENEETEEKKAKRAAKNAKYTTADMAKLRHILVNANRDKQLSAATKWVLGYYDSGGDTQAGNMVISTIPTKVKKAITAKTPLSQQFDALFAILYALNDWDPWMMDNEEYGAGGKLDSSINFLAKSWKTLLTHSDEELGIDAEFTRPGIECLLQNFAESVNSCETVETEFKWK